MSDHPSPSRPVDVAVLLGSAWHRLRDHNTRWRCVVQRWTSDPRIGKVQVVDFPAVSPRNLARAAAESVSSWDPRVDAFTGRVALTPRRTPLDGLAWRRTGRGLTEALGHTANPRVVVAATPLWASALPYLRADRVGFDGVDDWRAFPPVQRLLAHIDAGYRSAARANSASTVSAVLAERLGTDFGLRATTVANGVDLDLYDGPMPALVPGTTDGEYAVYVGVVQSRVDAALVAAAQRSLPVVIAGPVDASMTAEIAATGATALGPVAAAQVPALLRHARVGLVPHRIDALTTSMDPMKVREYLAAGLPVVTTVPPPPDLRSERVTIATDADAFERAVEAAARVARLDAPDPAVRHRSWADVADELFDVHVAPVLQAPGS